MNLTREKPATNVGPPTPMEYAIARPKRNPAWLIFGWICLLGVAGVFLYAGIEKIIEPRQFVIAIKNYRIVPEYLLNAMALYLPWVEVLAAIALLIPATRKAGAILIIAMLIMFMIAVSYSALYMGYNISCGCFGKGSGNAGIKTLALDATLVFATLAGIHFAKRPVNRPVVKI